MKKLNMKKQMGRTATIAGLLFIFALVLNLVAMAIYEPILGSPDLSIIYSARFRAIAGILLDLACVPAIVLIPVMLYPALKKYAEKAAIAYIGFRFLEVVYHIGPAIRKLSLIKLSSHAENAGADMLPLYQAMMANIHAQNDWSTLIYIAIFTIGALLFYGALLKSKVIPRVISIWGIAAAGLLLSGSILGFFEVFSLNDVMTYFGPPVALNELTLAFWLIFKGFNMEEQQ